jgi:hypothetical protein
MYSLPTASAQISLRGRVIFGYTIPSSNSPSQLFFEPFLTTEVKEQERHNDTDMWVELDQY